ncbi:hypothetical protein B0H17DRAFT_1186883 [Mycena rosella]|uniref:Uncharacterized protein n=1 Tax=Mycena rosella TaxID=1033263 RepID=A0AAD7FVT3_MYCRO|nr:hypothetical protein B0H17DRAFT_1186883 [Mycena rosella]
MPERDVCDTPYEERRRRIVAYGFVSSRSTLWAPDCVPSDRSWVEEGRYGVRSRIHAGCLGCHRQHGIVEEEKARRATYSRAWMCFKSERAGERGGLNDGIGGGRMGEEGGARGSKSVIWRCHRLYGPIGKSAVTAWTARSDVVTVTLPVSSTMTSTTYPTTVGETVALRFRFSVSGSTVAVPDLEVLAHGAIT